MGTSRFMVSAVLCLLVSASLARIVPESKTYYTGSRERTLQFLSDSGLPSGITKQNSAFLYLSLGPARFDFFAVAKPGSNTAAFAQVCDEALRAGGLPDLDVKYGRENSVDVLDADYDHSGFGHTSSSLSLDIARIRGVLASHGYASSMVLAVPQYANVVGLTTVGVGRGRYRYYDLAGVWGIVTSAESIGSREFLALAGFLLIVPLGAFMCFALGSRIAKNESLSLEARKASYGRAVMGGVFVVIGIHLAVFIWFFGSGGMSRMTDLWFGTQSNSILAIGLMLPLPVLTLAAKRMKAVEAPLLGTTVEAMEARERDRARRRRPGFLVALGISAVFFAIGVIGLEVYHQRRMMILTPLGALLGLFAMSYMEHAARKRDGVQ